MSPKLRHLSGKEVLSIFNILGFKVHSQRGSHVKIFRLLQGKKQTLTIPMHSELDAGTLRAIIRQATRYIPESELRPHFYTE